MVNGRLSLLNRLVLLLVSGLAAYKLFSSYIFSKLNEQIRQMSEGMDSGQAFHIDLIWVPVLAYWTITGIVCLLVNLFTPLGTSSFQESGVVTNFVKIFCGGLILYIIFAFAYSVTEGGCRFLLFGFIPSLVTALVMFPLVMIWRQPAE